MDKLKPVNALLIDYTPATPTRGIEPTGPELVRAGDVEFNVQPYQHIAPPTKDGTRGFGQHSTLAKATLKTNTGATNPWDVAHHAREHSNQVQLKFVEPDVIHVNKSVPEQSPPADGMRSFGGKATLGLYDEEWPHPGIGQRIWHNDADFSQLKQAREAVMDLTNAVRIAHFDTGIVQDHSMLPEKLLLGLQKSFGHDDDNIDDASDRANPIINGVGHGTSTLLLMAGRKINYPDYQFNDFLGGAPWAEIIPVRVCRSVVLLSTSSFVDALDYVIGLGGDPATQVDIVTMSMGGLPTRAWATSVNAAYDNGIFVTAASGDNTGGLPTTRTVYPARFRRVVNVTGVCYDNTPYYHGNIFHTKAVQGNFGPEFLMDNAIAAFSPNVPWIIHDADNHVATDKIGLGGAGTSASTPQVAAAAANYIRKYQSVLQSLQPWQKVEAVRNALFKSAAAVPALGDKQKLYYGNGVLRANNALGIPVNTAGLSQQPEDKVRFPLFHLLFREMQPADPAQDSFQQMIEVEMLQLINSDSWFQDILEPVQFDFTELSTPEKKKLIDAIIESDAASNTLKNYLKTNYSKIVN